MNSICSIIVTFNPSAEFPQILKAILSQCSQVVIVDNASEQKKRDVLKEISRWNGVQLISLSKNMGIGHALNCGVKHALANNFKWIATFDQDSMPSNDFFSNMLEQWGSSNLKTKIKLISPVYKDPHSFNSHPSRLNTEHFLETTMASGNLISSDIFNIIGLYREEFFMDYIDHDFCLRLNKHNYKILECEDAFLVHKLGNLSIHNFLLKRINATHHNFKRRYFITRNRIVLYKEYIFSNFNWVFNDFICANKEFIKIILFETQKYKKLKAIFFGTLDGILSNLKNNRSAFCIK